MNLLRRLGFAAILLLAFTFAVGQEHGTAAAPPQTPANESAPQPSDPAKSTGVREDLAHASNQAAGRSESGAAHEEEEGAEFKHSPSVRFIATHTGLSLTAAYWLLVSLNFLIIAVLVGWALKKNLPGMFKARTETIRKSMDEARHASEDANRRLSDIESRLGRLDSEIQEMRTKAEADAVAEEQRIRAAAEDDRRKIVAMTEQEIDAAAKAARRELKAYAADLAVSLAEKRIKVDAKTDEALVETFVRQLGKDGR
jgi:F-type H+-transporting ATPase subunit b